MRDRHFRIAKARHDLADTALYGIVADCPPRIDDFLSYEALGKSYDRRDFFKGVGISMHTTRKRSAAVAHRYRRASAIAKLDLPDAPIVWARTGGAGHITVWAPGKLLVDRVGQCERHE